MVARAATILHHEEPQSSCYPQPLPPTWNQAQDLRCITTNFQYLQTSGWYWGSISASQAREVLQTKSEGTFLVRDSSHPQYMLALSVMTRCGPTSVRIQYNRGCFWLDSMSPHQPHLQAFPDVPSLVQHYTVLSQTAQDLESVPPQTKLDPMQHAAKDIGVPLKLLHPLHKMQGFPSLQHLARLAINKHTNCTDQLPLPKSLLHFLQNYPFFI
ncbi:cytokine-inducible SH2-containing protein-like [Girardinichthys multiradiatus]|uniref:cytokine-inducible SH2-containing protein-like n=1 Tax=Girardinichthys multiradiatus TaxID=208333 RepID=UPI001FADC115|nr:cytokine-inducible SH2-containing protein-like [Girardinichthys multiradiatus]